jgi:hypothetical protein
VRGYVAKTLRARKARAEAIFVAIGAVLYLGALLALAPFTSADAFSTVIAGVGVAVLLVVGAARVIYARRPSSPYAQYQALREGDPVLALQSLGATVDG